MFRCFYKIFKWKNRKDLSLKVFFLKDSKLSIGIKRPNKIIIKNFTKLFK